MSHNEDLARRVRCALSDATGLREQKMMGALCFMINDHMCCGVTGEALMVRIGAAAHEAALRRPHVRTMEISGRKLRGFILIDPPGTEADTDLQGWITAAQDFVATLAAKPARK